MQNRSSALAKIPLFLRYLLKRAVFKREFSLKIAGFPVRKGEFHGRR